MKTSLKALVGGITLAISGACAAQTAERYPVKPVRIIVASAPGGLVDISTRLFAQKMADRLGRPVVVENRAGAETLVGIRAVKDMPADGYTLLATSSTITAQPSLKLEPGYDLMRDFVGIGTLVRSPWIMVIGPGQPDRSIADFVARAKATPDQMAFASGGVGTAPYLGAESFLQRAGVKILHVPYRGNGPAMTDLISGRISMMFEGASSAAPKIRSGQMRALGVTSAKRLSAFPEIPTFAEQGIPNFTSYVWVGLFAPAGTPKDAVRVLGEAVQAASKELRPRLEGDGVEAPSVTPEEFSEALKRELVEMKKLVEDLGLKKN